MSTYVVLVDQHDREIGAAEKLEAHRNGALHRAVSVLALDRNGRLIVQKRSASKYHSGGLWSNSACTHPLAGEDNAKAAARCLKEELGLHAIQLEEIFSFTYRAAVSPELTEHEFDHVFVCSYEGEPVPNPQEVAAWRTLSFEQLTAEIDAAPELWTPWCALIARRMKDADVQLSLLKGA